MHIFFKIFASVWLLMPWKGIGQYADTTFFMQNAWPILLAETVYDVDSNLYHTQQLGTQVWMVENLSATHFNTGDEIAVIPGNKSWSKVTEPACADIFGRTDHLSDVVVDRHGILYNGYVVIDVRNVCPTGWHVPSLKDWSVLMMHIDSVSTAWNAAFMDQVIYVDETMDSTDIQNLVNANAYADADLEHIPYQLFAGPMNGMRVYAGIFSDYNTWTSWWSSDSLAFVDFGLEEIYYSEYSTDINTGFSIRCIGY